MSVLLSPITVRSVVAPHSFGSRRRAPLADDPSKSPPTARPASGRSAGPVDELDLSSAAAKSPDELTPEEQEVVQELAARDREVRAHEQAHLAAAGPYARGGPSYSFQTGPDGRNYAIGGEVQIDTSPVEGDPEATIRKAQIVRAAALAPAEPSSQDRAVAAAAAKQEQIALAELRQKNQEESSGSRIGPEAAAADGLASGERRDKLLEPFAGLGDFLDLIA
ncbi:MAG: hypothetical protein MI861_26770 [Pirellulales bacterium]|nr:hypothetical protein [Pirellulales bacterium]